MESKVEIVPAGSADIMGMENMMQFFNYDLSEWYPISFAQTGRYALRPKGAYWARADLAPFLIRVNGELAGFAVVDGEVVEPQATYNMGYFFVARRYRKQGVGRRVAHHLLEKYPGRWEIYHLRRNPVAGDFWRRVLAAPAISDLAESACLIHEEESVLFQFTVNGGRVPPGPAAPLHR